MASKKVIGDEKMRLEKVIFLWFIPIFGRNINGIPDYQLRVSFKGKEFALNFIKSQMDDCFDQFLEYRLAKENGGMCKVKVEEEGYIKHSSRGSIAEWLQNQNDFLDVITRFLDSRIALGWSDWVYQLNIEVGNVSVDSNFYNEVFRADNLQIWEDIPNRWSLSYIKWDPSNDSYVLSFDHSLDQHYPVYYKVSQNVLEKNLGLTFVEKNDFTEVTEQFNKSSELRHIFSRACDLMTQQFKRNQMLIEDSNSDSFFRNPEGFVTSTFKIPVAV
jgi:hypothetical protein